MTTTTDNDARWDAFVRNLCGPNAITTPHAPAQFGVWSITEGCFVETGFPTRMDAYRARRQMIRNGDSYTDLKMREACAVHPEQPGDTCADCE
jgi:hypothetical protein